MTIDTLFFIAVLVMSVVIHEVAHGYAAYALGDPTAKLAGRLTLNPLKHLDWFGSLIMPALLIFAGLPVIGWAKPVPYNPYNLRGGKWGPAWVAIAGPASNFVLASIFGLLARLLLASQPLAASLCAFVTLINLTLCFFNLIPVIPLDGSKIVLALIPYKYRHIERWLYQYQLVFMIVIILLVTETNVLTSITGAVFNLLTGQLA
jgi:Zn-dependent protease